MDLSFKIFGVSKQNKGDFKELYDLTHCQVYALILTTVKDKVLAREILIETYKRVWAKAPFFDTDFSGEFWLYNIVKNLCENVLHDKALNTSSRSNRIDGFSKIATNALFMLKADRGQILVLRCVTRLKSSDIAKLLWYYKSAEKKEYKLALKELASLSQCKQSVIPSLLKAEISKLNPDFWDAIDNNKSTMVDHISDDEHFVLENDACEKDEQEKEVVKLPLDAQAKKRFIKKLIIVLCVFAALIFIPTAVILNKTKKDVPIITVQFGNKIAIVEIGDTAYYQNYKDSSKLYSYDFTSKNKKLLCDDKIKELVTDGQYLFYRNENDGRLYRINTDGSDKKQISQNPGTSMALDGENVYYSEKDGIYRMKKDGSSRELVLIPESEDMYRYNMEVYEGKLYFSSGVGGGIFYVNLSEPGSRAKAIYTAEAYDFQIYEGYLYFNIKTSESNLYRLNLKDEKLQKIPNTVLRTQAFYLFKGKIFFDGFSSDSNSLATAPVSSIYSINIDGSGLEKCFVDAASDMLVTEKRIYCYYPTSNGKLKVYSSASYSQQPEFIFGLN